MHIGIIKTNLIHHIRVRFTETPKEIFGVIIYGMEIRRFVERCYH